jgi:hypothetical protein
MESFANVGKPFTSFSHELASATPMADLITPVIVVGFSATTVLVVLGFLLVRQRSGRPRFESQDYYKSYKRPERRSTSPFRQEKNVPDRNQNRLVGLAVVALVVIAIAVAVLYDLFDGLLIFIFLPVIIRFIRTRSETRRAPRDESQSY